jgi:hypothetical protein
MRKLLIILPVIFLIGCTLTPTKNKHSVVNKELTILSGVTKAEALLLYAEDFESQTYADFSKAGLRVVLLSLQNTSSGDTYQINSLDIHGTGDLANVKQIDYDKAINLMERSTQFIESGTESRVVKTVRNVTIGALVGGIAVGIFVGYDPISFMVASAAGAVVGGSYGFIEGVKGNDLYAAKNIMGIISGEIVSEKLPALITVLPDSKIDGILIFPEDVRALIADIKGTTYHVDIH